MGAAVCRGGDSGRSKFFPFRSPISTVKSSLFLSSAIVGVGEGNVKVLVFDLARGREERGSPGDLRVGTAAQKSDARLLCRKVGECAPPRICGLCMSEEDD